MELLRGDLDVLLSLVILLLQPTEYLGLQVSAAMLCCLTHLFMSPRPIQHLTQKRPSLDVSWLECHGTHSLSAFRTTTKDFEKEKGKTVLSRGVCWVQNDVRANHRSRQCMTCDGKQKRHSPLFVGCYCSKRKIHKRKALLLLPSQKTEWNLSVSGDLVFCLCRTTAWLWHQPTGSQIHIKPFY